MMDDSAMEMENTRDEAMRALQQAAGTFYEGGAAWARTDDG